MRAYIFAGALLPAFMVVACSSGSGTTDTTSNLVSQAAASVTTTHDAAKVCFTDFQTCISAAADATAVVACQDTLRSCLPTASGVPTPPDLCSDTESGHDHGHDCNADGGMPRGGPGGGGPGGGGPGGGGPGGPGGNPPPRPDGGLPPPPDGHGGPHGHGPPLTPDGHIALATCHAELKKCLDAGTAKDTCVAADHQCVHDALTADFAQLCADIATQCAACPTSDRCVELTARCAAGVPALPDSP
ncbi:MAG: hypothetical protein JWN44_2210 [Myxococcales bacterium]|nr:hypothetical protein [Myxococcales bacterium]